MISRYLLCNFERGEVKKMSHTYNVLANFFYNAVAKITNKEPKFSFRNLR